MASALCSPSALLRHQSTSSCLVVSRSLLTTCRRLTSDATSDGSFPSSRRAGTWLAPSSMCIVPRASHAVPPVSARTSWHTWASASARPWPSSSRAGALPARTRASCGSCSSLRYRRSAQLCTMSCSASARAMQSCCSATWRRLAAPCRFLPRPHTKAAQPRCRGSGARSAHCRGRQGRRHRAARCAPCARRWHRTTRGSAGGRGLRRAWPAARPRAAQAWPGS
mmetsp:Transcript_77091/g.249495  ORF Transcript_77091/g.249495 Transcript_77091/m.249495 type:complete len:224 (+) Transcript_77091:182-853(+)